MRMTNVHSSLGDEDEATAHWQMVLELDPTHEDASYNLGVYHQRRRAFDDARPYFEIAARSGDPRA